MKILRINCRLREGITEPLPPEWTRYGGRGLIAQIMHTEDVIDTNPLGQKNKLIWAPGLLSGFGISSCDRISVGGQSPLTRGIKESNGGGVVAKNITDLGFCAIILEDQPASGDDWSIIYVSSREMRFDPANEIIGWDIPRVGEYLLNKYGKSVGISAIGPAGERQYLSAAIAHLDKDGSLSRMSARGGMGAVMGSKRIKALVFDAQRNEVPVIADPLLFEHTKKTYHQKLLNNEMTGSVWPKYGTAAMVQFCNAVGALPTNGFSQGNFDGADEISGETLYDLIVNRGGNPSHACMPGCLIRCSNTFADAQGNIILSPIEYETIALMGSNLGIHDLDRIAEMNSIANCVGVDTIEVGAAMGVLAGTPDFEFGNGDRAIQLMREIEQDTELGRTIANGACHTGRHFGIKRVPAVKGQAMPGYDPRGTKGTGVTFATSPQGADHTCGLTIRAKVDQAGKDGQIELSRTAQYKNAAIDSLGMCYFAAVVADEFLVKDLINAVYGWGVDERFMLKLGRETILCEREVNQKAGLTKDDDRIPNWIKEEALSPSDSVFDIPDEELDKIFED